MKPVSAIFDASHCRDNSSALSMSIGRLRMSPCHQLFHTACTACRPPTESNIAPSTPQTPGGRRDAWLGTPWCLRYDFKLSSIYVPALAQLSLSSFGGGERSIALSGWDDGNR